MDTTKSEKTSNLSVEQSYETTKEAVEEHETSKESGRAEYADMNSVELAQGEIDNAETLVVNNNISETLNVVVQHMEGNRENSDEYGSAHGEMLEKANVKSAQKETIEILNVELVAPRRSDFIETIDSKNETTNEVTANSENECMPNTEIHIEKITDNNQFQNETGLEEISVFPTMIENEPLANCSKKNTEPTKTSGLSLLAQYQSDDDTDSVVEVPITSALDYRNQIFEIDSESDSDDSSSSSDIECLNELRKTIEKRIDIADEDEGEDEDQDCNGKRRQQQKFKVKGELSLEDLPPIQDLQITVPEIDCVELGKIHSIVDQLVLVSTLPNSILLDLETVIFLEKGQKVLGEVFDVLGQVADPLYCVRFNSNKQIKEKEIKIGDVVYVAPKTQYTQYVILSNLMKTKGSDASWENDIEPPPRFLDYSDDEQEQLAKKQLRNKNRNNDNEDTSKRPRTIHNDDSMPTSSSYHSNSHHRNRYEQRNNRGSPAGHSNIRPYYNGPHQIQQRVPNHHRSSWHSNYNPQNFPTRPTGNFRMHLPQNQQQSPQAYHPNMPVYSMANAQNMSYPSSNPLPYGVPPMFHQQLMPPNPPHAPLYHQYSSIPPPPPGSQ